MDSGDALDQAPTLGPEVPHSFSGLEDSYQSKSCTLASAAGRHPSEAGSARTKDNHRSSPCDELLRLPISECHAAISLGPDFSCAYVVESRSELDDVSASSWTSTLPPFVPSSSS
jgi:hypothetical protein